MADRQPKAELLTLLEPLLREHGIDVEDVEVSSAGRRKLVRVLVDKDGGVTLDEVAGATTAISGLLDDNDVLDDAPYTLEVTSPGVDRPLTAPRHWRRNVDRLVAAQLSDGSTCTGRITEASDRSATLDVDGSSRTLAYADVVKARVEIEFNHPQQSSGTASVANRRPAGSGPSSVAAKG